MKEREEEAREMLAAAFGGALPPSTHQARTKLAEVIGALDVHAIHGATDDGYVQVAMGQFMAIVMALREVHEDLSGSGPLS